MKTCNRCGNNAVPDRNAVRLDSQEVVCLNCIQKALEATEPTNGTKRTNLPAMSDEQILGAIKRIRSTNAGNAAIRRDQKEIKDQIKHFEMLIVGWKGNIASTEDEITNLVNELVLIPDPEPDIDEIEALREMLANHVA